jgi:hypothetical protein
LKENKHQGKFHLLAIFLIPGFLAALFLAENWIVPSIYFIVALVIVYFIFRKK